MGRARPGLSSVLKEAEIPITQLNKKKGSVKLATNDSSIANYPCVAFRPVLCNAKSDARCGNPRRLNEIIRIINFNEVLKQKFVFDN